MSLLVLGVIVLAFAGLAGLCSFNPGDPEQGPVPEFDATASLESDARNLDFEVRDPDVPDGWMPNSGRVQQFGEFVSSHVGYVTDGETYVELVQSDAPVEDFRGVNNDGPRPDMATVPVGGREWTTFTGEDEVRPVWVSDFEGARVAITGSGTQDEFEQMALAVDEAEVLPAQ